MMWVLASLKRGSSTHDDVYRKQKSSGCAKKNASSGDAVDSNEQYPARRPQRKRTGSMNAILILVIDKGKEQIHGHHTNLSKKA